MTAFEWLPEGFEVLEVTDPDIPDSLLFGLLMYVPPGMDPWLEFVDSRL